MATSNFGWYNSLLNLYSITYDEMLYKADSYCEYHNLDKYDEIAYDKACDEVSKDLRVFDEFELEELNEFIDKLNDKIYEVAYRLYDSPRQMDQDEYYNLKDCKIFIESGHYEGFRIACDGYDYLNKTHKKMIQKMFRKIARKFGMYAYGLAYRFSNGETGFSLVKKYKYQYDLVEA